MGKLITAAVLAFFAMTVVPGTMAQDRQPTAVERFQAEEMEKFRHWRESIPDYDKRLYDRVKAINSRVVRLTNIVIAGFVLLLIIAPVGLYLVISQINAPLLPPTGDSEETDKDAEQESP